MPQLAACDNVTVKLSCLNTFDRACSGQLRPTIEQTVDMFGPSRCLFGSSFLIEKLWTTYAELIGVMRACLSRYSADEQRAIWHGTAAALYGV